MTTNRTRQRVTVTKRNTGEVFTGWTYDDGLQSLYTVHTETGDRYVSVLDEIVWH